MKRLILTTLTICFLIATTVPNIMAASQGLLLPESLKARSQMAADKKTVTIFIEEDDPNKITEMVNLSTAEYAQKGWTLFSIIPYTEGSDFEGFFITYQKKLIIL